MSRLAALADAMLDEPRWVEIRGALRRGEARVSGLSADRRSFVAVATRWSLIAVIGRPDAAWIAAAGASAEAGDVLQVAETGAEHVAAALPGWRRSGASALAWPGGGRLPDAPPAGAARLVTAGDLAAMAHVPAAMREELLDAAEGGPVAAALDGGLPASFAFARGVTESLWLVAVETLEGHRRRGLAGRAVRLLAAALGVQGKQPVWSAADGDAPSLGLAQTLGFEPAGRLATFAPDAPAF